jgi:hypothetical protein
MVAMPERSNETAEIRLTESEAWKKNITLPNSPFEIKLGSENTISISRHDMKAMCVLVNDKKTIGSLKEVLGFDWPAKRREEAVSKGYICEATQGDGQISLTGRGYDVLRSIVMKEDMRGTSDHHTTKDKLDLSPEHFRVLAALERDEPKGIETICRQLEGKGEHNDGTHRNDDFKQEYVKYLMAELRSLALAAEKTDDDDGSTQFVPTATGAYVPIVDRQWAVFGIDFLTAFTAEALSVQETLNDLDLLPADERKLVNRAVKEELWD